MSDHSSLRTPSQRIAWTATIIISTLVFIFLIAPILAIMPLSFSSGSYLTYPLPGLSLRWYDDFINSPRWMNSTRIPRSSAAFLNFSSAFAFDGGSGSPGS